MTDKEVFELIVVDGKRKWLVDGVKILPYVAGGSGDGDETPPPKPDPKPGDPPPKTFTQDELNDIIKKRLDGARSQSQADLMKELGITDPAEAKALIAAAKAAEEANATELDKARKEADQHKTSAAAAAAELAEFRLNSAITEELVSHGLTVAAAKRVRSMITVEKNDEDLIKEAIETLKKEMPTLFVTQGAGGPPGSNPGGAPPGGGGKPNDPQAVAQRTLHERHPHLKKTS
jgi:hypothetical protein